MVSPTASICETYRHSEQKQSQKFCGSKEGKNSETHPEKPEKGETGCVPGAGEGCSRYGRVGKPEIRTKMHQIAMQHMKKENRRNPSVFAGFLAGAEGLGLGCRLGRFAAERHWRSLTPRHALRRAQPCLVAKSYRTLTKKSGTAEAIPDFFGRGRRTRTLGTRFWRPLLYQLSYTPIFLLDYLIILWRRCQPLFLRKAAKFDCGSGNRQQRREILALKLIEC